MVYLLPRLRRCSPIWLVLTLSLPPVGARAAQQTPRIAMAPQTMTALSAADVRTIKERFVVSVLPTRPADIARVQTLASKYASSISADGSWADVQYSNEGRSVWGAADHLQRTLVMAKGARLYRSAGSANSVLDAAVLSALKCWTDHDYRNSNWWWNEIGTPELIGEIASLAAPNVSAEQLAKVVAIMQRSKWKTWTGANLTWGVTNQIVRGCLQGDGAAVAEAYVRLYQEVRLVAPNQEGIQDDDSFHQHGAQLYNGGYGLTFANDVGRFISFAYGTAAQIPADKMAIFSHYLLDGQQWMVWNDLFDYSAVGREITRAGKVAVPVDWTIGPISPAGPAYSLGNVVARLAESPSADQKALQSFAARLNGHPLAQPLVGNKQFRRSDYMAHRRAAFFASVKMLSNRMQGGEIVNGEGKDSVHLSDGATLLYQSGSEYRDIFAVWDWTKVPGTTAVQGAVPPGGFPGVGARGGSAFAGGVSDGLYGVCAMNLVRGTLSADKSWFFFDDAFVCLGAGITLSGSSAEDVVTDVNQVRLVGGVRSGAEHVDVTTGQTALTGGDVWVHHDNVGYLFGANSKARFRNDTQTGRWSDFGAGSSDPVTLPVFNLWIDHGKSPQNTTYQYVVLPGASFAETEHRAHAPGIAVLANDTSVQAVYDEKSHVLGIVFRKPATVTTPLGAVATDQPCLLLIRDTAAGRTVTASNPENLPLTVNVTVAGKPAAISLPGGSGAGSSVSVVLGR